MQTKLDFSELLATLWYRTRAGIGPPHPLTPDEWRTVRSGLSDAVHSDALFNAVFEFYLNDPEETVTDDPLPPDLRRRAIVPGMPDVSPDELAQIVTTPVWFAELRDAVAAGDKAAVPASTANASSADWRHHAWILLPAAAVAASIAVVAFWLARSTPSPIPNKEEPLLALRPPECEFKLWPQGREMNARGPSVQGPSGTGLIVTGGTEFDVSYRVWTDRPGAILYEVDRDAVVRKQDSLRGMDGMVKGEYGNRFDGTPGTEFFFVVLDDPANPLFQARHPMPAKWLHSVDRAKLQAITPGDTPTVFRQARDIIATALHRAGWTGSAEDVVVLFRVIHRGR